MQTGAEAGEQHHGVHYVHAAHAAPRVRRPGRRHARAQEAPPHAPAQAVSVTEREGLSANLLNIYGLILLNRN